MTPPNDNPDSNLFAQYCEREFAEVHRKLDRLDQAIRGNGAPGINVRLDRLEQNARRQSKLIWLILGSIFTAVATAGAAWAIAWVA